MTKTTSSNPQANESKTGIVDKLKDQFKLSQDLIYKKHCIENESFDIMFFESLIDTQYLDKNILPTLSIHTDKPIDHKLTSFFQAEDVSLKSKDQLSDLLFQGNIFFLTEDKVLSIQAGEFPKRDPEESSLETSIRGPRDGFVEDIKTNISLIRRRLNTSSLCLEHYTIGKRSKTKVALMYLDDIIDKSVLKEIKTRLNKVELDILTSIYELESSVRDRPYSAFPTMSYSGRPDFIVQSLNQGRFALLVDGNPSVVYAPTNFLLETKSPEDSYISYFFVSMERMIRLLGAFISGFLPGIWIAFSSYNIEQIPYLLVATISVSRFGLPLSAPIEMFVILFLFELFNEAGIRLPRAIGQTVAVLGGLIVGDAAIRAGLTSPTMLVVAAITYISSFTLVNPSLSTSLAVIRFSVILLSTFFGLFGVIIGFILSILYLSSLTSFGAPYLGSVAPINLKEVMKAFLKVPQQYYKSRTALTSPNDPTRGDNE